MLISQMMTLNAQDLSTSGQTASNGSTLSETSSVRPKSRFSAAPKINPDGSNASRQTVDSGNDGVMNDDALVTVNFPNTAVQGVIPFYTKLTGKKIILDSRLQGDPLRMIAPKPLTKREAVAFIESTLLLNGYAVIPMDASTVKLIQHAGGKHPSPEGLPVYSSIRDVPEGESVIHFVLPLNHISPEDATKAFQQVIKLHTTYGAMTPVTNASALIITENSATVRSIYEIAKIIDVPPAEISNEMVKLERSDAESIAEIINQIYEDKEKGNAAGASSVSGPAVGSPPLAEMPGNTAQALLVAGGLGNSANTNPTAARVKVVPYRRTNHLLVIGRPVDITYIKGLIVKLDQKSDGTNFMKRKLRYLAVGDFMPVAKNALSRDTDIQSESGSSLAGESRGRNRQGNTASNNSLRSQQNNLSDGGFGSSSGNSGFGNSGGRSLGTAGSMLESPEAQEGPQSMVVGRTLLIADSQSNSLIVSGSPEHIQIIDQLIGEIDVRPQQIYISTIIGQVTLGSNYKVGFDMLRLLDDFTLSQNLGTTTVTTDTPNTGNTGSTGTTVTGAGSAGLVQLPLNLNKINFNQLNLYGQLGSLSRYANMLEGNSNFKLLSRPSVYTTNNNKAVISSGQRIAIPVNSLSNLSGTGNTAAVSSSIDYQDVVLKLEVVPLINSDDEVTLKIAQVNDNIVGSQEIGGNSVPTIGTQTMETTVTVKSGRTIVLGGLITERVTKSGSGVFFLRRIPVIKHLFGTTTNQTDRDELLIFIQPTIIPSKDPLDLPNRLEVGRSSVLEDALRFGEIQTSSSNALLPPLTEADRVRIPKALPVR